ncbi:hypothetical protein [Actinotalea sp. K2]|uniref:hypothetical protein n=1 Tax=Actinotalea sp. K2 TaxID=2939438 RepID=UPI0020183420|nr:hypothetical protein [Actinotalea sp. K2]MCL3862933.1 hypothetical protein [Actinotalea sp. K2]
MSKLPEDYACQVSLAPEPSSRTKVVACREAPRGVRIRTHGLHQHHGADEGCDGLAELAELDVDRVPLVELVLDPQVLSRGRRGPDTRVQREEIALLAENEETAGATARMRF